MTFVLLGINVKTSEIGDVGHATFLTDATKQLMKLAKQEAGRINSDAEVVEERDGYYVKLGPDCQAFFTFDKVAY